MMRDYNICGLAVRCDFRHETMTSRAAKYLMESVGEPDISIEYSETRMTALSAAAPNLSPAECEVICTAQAFYTLLLKHGGLMLHSSAVAMDGNAYLFSAPSGTGKSTHTEQWLKLFGERASIINDDKPAIMVREDGIFAYGTPWSGKSDLNLNIGVPLKGICVLERSPENHIERLDDDTAVFSILNQTVRPAASPKAMELLLELLDAIIGQVPVWKMGCNISTEAAKVAFEAMSKG